MLCYLQLLNLYLFICHLQLFHKTQSILALAVAATVAVTLAYIPPAIIANTKEAMNSSISIKVNQSFM